MTFEDKYDVLKLAATPYLKNGSTQSIPKFFQSFLEQNDSKTPKTLQDRLATHSVAENKE